MDDLRLHKFKRYRVRKNGFLNWFKREVLFAENLSNKDMAFLFLKCLVILPMIIGFTWLIFAGLYAFQGVWR